MGRSRPARTVERMSSIGPTQQYETPQQYDASQQYGVGENRWEQPRFGTAEPTVSGTVLPAAPWTGHTRTVAPPSAVEARLRTIVALVWPIALVLAIATGHWVALLVGALIVGGVLRRRLLQLRYQRTVARVPFADGGWDCASR